MNKTNSAAQTVTIHGVLAGAYKAGKQRGPMLTHASLNASDALCGSLKYELCDWVEGEAPATMPTCKRCAAKVAKLLGITLAK